MKRALFLTVLIIGFFSNVGNAKDERCVSRIKGDTEYAQWGIELRAEMLRECGRKPSKSCLQKYENKIRALSDKDTEAIRKAFPNPRESDPAYNAAIDRSVSYIMAARGGYTGPWRSAEEVADFQYRLCAGLPLEDPKPARSNRPMPPMPPPMMPMEPSVSSRLSPMQPEIIGGGSMSGGCTNYTLMGPDGRAQYCQNCCYGGTCNVICY